jgi:tetratricopeptide (TPR) repeat protein
MISEPYLFFAEVSLDLSRGKFQSGIDKLEPFSDQFLDSYLFHFLYAKALKGLQRNTLASKYFQKCCAIAPANQIARQELAELQASVSSQEQVDLPAEFDAVTDELEKLSAALMKFEPAITSENSDPTSILEQKQPFSDDTTIAVPTESLANLFTAQGAYKKAIKIYTLLIQLKPQNAECYQQEIDALLELL